MVTREVPQGKNVDPKSVTARIIVAFSGKNLGNITNIHIFKTKRYSIGGI